MSQQPKKKKGSNQKQECDLPPYRPCIDSYKIPGFISLPPSTAHLPPPLPPWHDGMPSSNCACEEENYCNSETCRDSESCNQSKPKFCPQGFREGNQPAKKELIDDQAGQYESNTDSGTVGTELKLNRGQQPRNKATNVRGAPRRLLQAPTSSSCYNVKDSSASQVSTPVQTSFTSYKRATNSKMALSPCLALRVPTSRRNTATSGNGPLLPFKSTNTPSCCKEIAVRNELLAPSVSTRSSDGSTGCPGCNVIAPNYMSSPNEDSLSSVQSSQSNLCRGGCHGELSQTSVQAIFREPRHATSPAKRESVYNDTTDKICRGACNILMTQVPKPASPPAQQEGSTHEGFAKQSSRAVGSSIERRISNDPVQHSNNPALHRKVSGNLETAGSVQEANLRGRKSFDLKTCIKSKTPVPTSALDLSKEAETATQTPGTLDASKNVTSTKPEETKTKVDENIPKDFSKNPEKSDSRSSKKTKSSKRAKENISKSSSKTSNKTVKKTTKSKTLLNVTLSCAATTTDCSCHFPPRFRQFTCTGNLSGNCTCSPKHE